MKKTFYFVSGVIAILLVVSLFSVVSAFRLPWGLQLGPSPTSATPTTTIDNANECRRDERCEVNQLDAKALNVQGGFDNFIDAANFVLAYRSALISLKQPSSNTNQPPLQVSFYYNDTPSHVVVHDVLKINGQHNPQTGSVNSSIEVFEDIILHPLEGNSTAYACLDAQGKLFRSNSPCR